MKNEIYWFTGQSGSGKTELANQLKIYLNHNFNEKFVIIDGDDIRELFNNTDYSVEGRKNNVNFVQKMCLFLKKNNILPIVCMVSPFAEQRSTFLKEENGMEIYVHCNEIRGREHFHIDYYEPPVNYENAVEIDTTNKSVEKSFEELWKNLL